MKSRIRTRSRYSTEQRAPQRNSSITIHLHAYLV